MFKRYAILIASVAILLAASVAVWFAAGAPTDKRAKRLAERISRPIDPPLLTHPASEQWMVVARVCRKPRWDVADVQLLSDMAKEAYLISGADALASGKPLVPQKVDMNGVAQHASGSMLTRLSLDKDLPDDARAKYLEYIMWLYHHERSDLRLEAVLSLVQSQIITDPALRPLVEKAMSDPDSSVATMARLQHGYMLDILARRRARGLLKPGQ